MSHLRITALGHFYDVAIAEQVQELRLRRDALAAFVGAEVGAPTLLL